MLTSKSTIRVRYDEVDKMSYVYHGNYASYYHIGRTELLRKVGICDYELEKYHIILPVIELNSKFIKPVFYDETITIITSLIEFPRSRMKFSHKIFNQNHDLVNEAFTTVAFVDNNTRKPLRVPETILHKLELFMNLINQ
ncbi:MAG: thioesterase family protein [Bacteroidales bacterium]|jgi:acyl-CoA thioester hydrolase|nr:thioesterase family protein [Bacteroidales bacterium]